MQDKMKTVYNQIVLKSVSGSDTEIVFHRRTGFGDTR